MLIGYEKIFNELKEAVEKGHRGPFLLTGASRIGKKKIALELAGQFFSPGSSDVLLMEPEAGQILLDKAKEAIKFLHLRPMEGSFRMLIIDEIHLLRREAANALLKILEESSALIIGVTSRPEDVLETIRSRFLETKIKELSQEEIFSVLRSKMMLSRAKEEAIKDVIPRVGVILDMLKRPDLMENKKRAEENFNKIFFLNYGERLIFREENRNLAAELPFWFEKALISLRDRKSLPFLTLKEKNNLIKKFGEVIDQSGDNTLNQGRVLDNFLLDLPVK